MKPFAMFLLPALLFAVQAPASADSWKHGHGHGRYHRDYKETYWDGHCKVERKFKRNGDYKEKRKCRAPRPVYHDRYYDEQPAVYYVEPRPVYVRPRPVYVEPGVSIHGSFYFR